MRSSVCFHAAIHVTDRGVGDETIWLPETQERTFEAEVPPFYSNIERDRLIE
jgi:hypothetical protein